jgi:beta-lactam-binding protein with PASTA domain
MNNILKADSLKKVFLHLGIIFVLFMGLLIFFFYVYLPNATHHDQTITVPKLVGMNAEEVENFLKSKNLRFKINDSSYSTEVKPNTVLTQHPLPETKVKENRMIYVSVAAKNPPKVAMPQLVDLSINGAKLTLKQHDLVLGNVISVPGQTDLVYEQLVGSQKVEPGSMIPKGTRVNLKVGNNSGVDVPIPDFTGMSITDAKLMASELGVIIDIRPDANATEGTIVKQKPAFEEGAVIRSGETIDLWTE